MRWERGTEAGGGKLRQRDTEEREGKLRQEGVSPCWWLRSAWGQPWDITALGHQHRHVLAGWLSPAGGRRGYPGKGGARKSVRLGPGQGKELIPLLAGSQMAAALFPCLAD